MNGEDDHAAPRQPIDLRRHRQRTDRNLLIGGFALGLVVGGGLIWTFYGLGAMFMGWLVLSGGMLLFALIYGVLKLMEIWSAPRRDE